MVPIRLDIFTIIIFLGAVQGLFLSAFFILGRKHVRLSNRLLGCLILTFAAFSVDIFLGYSGYMVRVLHLVDFTEPLNFVVGPLIYLYTITAIYRSEKLTAKQYLHFLPALFYLIYFLLFFLQTIDYKYNAYIDAYYPELPRLDAPARWHQDPLLIKKNISALEYTQIFIYLTLSVKVYREWLREAVRSKAHKETRRRVKVMLTGLAFGAGTTFLIQLFFERDLGEYLIACVIMVMIYTFSFYVIRYSLFLRDKEEPNTTKYEKSTFPSERVDVALLNLREVMEVEKPYLSPTFSLPILAEKTRLSTHLLSQLLNGHLNQTFYEFTAEYRVKEAQLILRSVEGAQKSIEQVAEEVGYFSKSSFNTAFKKITGLTPSQYRKQAPGVQAKANG